MKTKIYTFLFFVSLVFCTACTKNDDMIVPSDSVLGTWNLKKVYGGLQGINIDYSQGDVIWTFDFQNSTLIVENNITTNGPEDIHAGLDTGTYDFNIQQNGQVISLFIEGIKKGDLYVEDDKLSIDDGLVADGFVTVFVR